MKMAAVAAFQREQAKTASCEWKWARRRYSWSNDLERRQLGSVLVFGVDVNNPLARFGQYQCRGVFPGGDARVRDGPDRTPLRIGCADNRMHTLKRLQRRHPYGECQFERLSGDREVGKILHCDEIPAAGVRRCYGSKQCNAAGQESQSGSHLRLLLVLPTHSVQWPSLPELVLNRIDTIFFPYVAVGRPVRPFTPETLLDLL